MDSGSLEQYALQVANDAHLRVLGRLPSQIELQNFMADVISTGNATAAMKKLVEQNLASTKSNDAEIDALQSLSPEEHWKQTLHLTAPYVLRSLYLGILGREPERVHVNNALQRLQESDFVSLIRSFESSGENFHIWRTKFLPEMIQKEIKLSSNQESSISLNGLIKSEVNKLESDIERYQNFHNANSGIEFGLSNYPRLNVSESLALVFVPNEGWLPYALAIANYLNTNYQRRSVFVYLEWSPALAQAMSFDTVVFDVIHINEFRKIPNDSNFSPDIICTHSFGWLDETRYLLSRFPEARFYVFADGLKNGVDAMLSSHKPIDGSIFFSYALPIPEIKHEITIPIDTIFKYVGDIANVYRFQPNIELLKNELPDYAVIYLRYWGGGYAYTIDLYDAVQSIVDTSTKYLSVGDTVVVKNDARAKAELFSLVCAALLDKGFNVVPFADYLLKYGIGSAYQNLPVEYFFAKGLLCRAKAHVVLDSSLGYIVASSPYIKRQTNIILGADISFLEQKIKEYPPQDPPSQEKNSISMTIGTIRRYSKQYCEAILNSEACGSLQLLDSYNNNLFHIRLT